jgi:hypothetical protein
MANDKVSIFDGLTGETIVREMTDAEQAEHNAAKKPSTPVVDIYSEAKQSTQPGGN